MISAVLAVTIFLPFTATGVAIRLLAPTEADLHADPVVARLIKIANEA